jgi:hypothetical protein
LGNENGTRPRAGSNGAPQQEELDRKPCPRRIILLRGDEQSEQEAVLAELIGAEPRGKDVHDEIQRHAERHRGRCIAAEWHGTLGWTRFLWCRRE